MKRVCIIGCGGAGKSTLSRKLHTLTGLPILHLDIYFWNPGWKESPKHEWKAKVASLIQQEAWIMDGNYGGTMDIRFTRADTLIFLDFPTWLCAFRVLKRIWQYRGKTRPDLPEGCPESFDWPFFHYVLQYRKTRRPTVLAKLQDLENTKNIFILRTPKEVQDFINRF